jgi:hypothetical protein
MEEGGGVGCLVSACHLQVYVLEARTSSAGCQEQSRSSHLCRISLTKTHDAGTSKTGGELLMTTTNS